MQSHGLSEVAWLWELEFEKVKSLINSHLSWIDIPRFGGLALKKPFFFFFLCVFFAVLALAVQTNGELSFLRCSFSGVESYLLNIQYFIENQYLVNIFWFIDWIINMYTQPI